MRQFTFEEAKSIIRDIKNGKNISDYEAIYNIAVIIEKAKDAAFMGQRIHQVSVQEKPNAKPIQAIWLEPTEPVKHRRVEVMSIGRYGSVSYYQDSI